MNRFCRHHVPIYDLRLVVGVYDCPKKIAQLIGPWFGNVDVGNNLGTCLYNGGDFAIVLNTKPGMQDICHELIAHEVLHLTNRMMEFCSNPITKHSHEPHAYLCGFLTQLVYEDLHSWGIKVNLRSNFNPNHKKFRQKKIKA